MTTVQVPRELLERISNYLAQGPWQPDQEALAPLIAALLSQPDAVGDAWISRSELTPDISGEGWKARLWAYRPATMATDPRVELTNADYFMHSGEYSHWMPAKVPAPLGKRPEAK